METITVPLTQALTVGGKEITEVSLRASTVGDEEDAMQQAVQLGKAKNSITFELCLVSKLTRLPYDTIRHLPGRDYAKIRQAMNKLNKLELEDPTLLTQPQD